MNLRYTLCSFLLFLLAGCTDDFAEREAGAFFKLYGNGTIQEAVAMHISGEDMYLIGNQYVRNQDSSAVLLIRADREGNQLWSATYFGKGHTTAKAILALPSGELLVLASGRAEEADHSMPVLYRISREGKLLNEHFIGEEEAATSRLFSSIPEDMVLGNDGSVLIAGNRLAAGGGSLGFIKKVALETGKELDQRLVEDSEMTEVKRIFSFRGQYLLVGNTWREEEGEIEGQSLFLATYSADLIEENRQLAGSLGTDIFKDALLSSRKELVILSAEGDPALTGTKGVIRFVRPHSLEIGKTAQLVFGQGEQPEGIEEEETGSFYVASHALNERRMANILLYKTDHAGLPQAGSAAVEIGGEGNDKVAQLQLLNGYAYLLKTIDMQNENTLISLSKVQYQP